MLGIFRKRPRTTPADATLAGFFEGRNGERLTGWAFDRSSPERHATVTLRADDGTERTTRADVYRTDLYQAGFGDGHVAFSVPAARFVGARAVRAFFSDGREIAGGPAGLAVAAGTERIIGSLHLRLDPPQPAGLSVSGSIVDAADPGRRCRVTLRLRGRDVGASRATLFRPELSQDGTDGLHGFRLMFDGLDLKPNDRLELVDGDSGAVLARLRN